MKSPFYFMVRPYNGRRYDNLKDIGGSQVIISVSEEDHTVSNRLAEVISTPVGYEGDISPGDFLLVHHNVFKFYNDMRGVQRSGRSFLKDDIFFVDTEQFFMHKKNGIWKAVDRYCFVKPVENIKSSIMSFGREESLIGEMAYPNDYLVNMGVKSGDFVVFPPYSKYEFNVDGERMYRIYDHQIVMIL